MVCLTGFLLCGNIEGNGGQLSSSAILNPLSELRLKYIPGQFSFGICATLGGLTPDNHTLNYAIQDPDGKELLRGQETIIQRSPGAANHAELPGIVFMNTFYNFDIPVEGKYKIVFIVDGAPAAEHGFSVIKAV